MPTRNYPIMTKQNNFLLGFLLIMLQSLLDGQNKKKFFYSCWYYYYLYNIINTLTICSARTGVLPVCSRSVPGVFTVCSPNVLAPFMVCSRFVPRLCLSVNRMYEEDKKLNHINRIQKLSTYLFSICG